MKTRVNRPSGPHAQAPRGTVRIIGGRWKRTVIPIADAPGLRPTPDRVRETVFNWLAHAFGGELNGLSAIDLFAGSGALGIEAASRGATSVVSIERHDAAVDALCALRDRLDAKQIDVRLGDALRIGAQLVREGATFDLVFLDPPFAAGLEQSLALASRLCAPRGFIYAEAASALSEARLAAHDLEIYRADKAGDVFYHLLQRKIIEEETPCLSPSTRGRSTL